ncbi:hypothetical protein NliqN6_1743 [Naganishia liquefaciens]|uniref:Uncharacterized protein n=1 Tax=Naganishia liquefaciens TaxID=104408 RepID=A0A8H3TQY8_9TREE|nr:hypothetical protein NliqN6_1743 [Naganishia liquefaciens]
MYTTTARKRHRSTSSSSPEESAVETRQQSRSPSPGRDSDFESLPAHLVGGPSRKRRRKDAGHGHGGPFIRTGFESMALESDEETVRGNGNGVNGSFKQENEFVDETPPIAEREFNFQPGTHSGAYDTYRTTTADGDMPWWGMTRVVKPESVEMPLSPDGEVPPGGAKGESFVGEEGMVEDASDPEAGGIPAVLRGKNWYEPEKDRIVVTSLSDTESDDSPDPATPPIDLSAATDEIIEIPSSDQLTQPGSRGFTIHPTLLNRLNRMTEAERSRLPFGPGRYPRTEERGLILYRTPGETLNGVTRTGEMDSDDDDGDRFQVLPDEEAMSTDGMEVEPEPDGGMAAMSDVEVDQSGIMEDVDSMEIG